MITHIHTIEAAALKTGHNVVKNILKILDVKTIKTRKII
jgi:hypothetical protein